MQDLSLKVLRGLYAGIMLYTAYLAWSSWDVVSRLYENDGSLNQQPVFSILKYNPFDQIRVDLWTAPSWVPFKYATAVVSITADASTVSFAFDPEERPIKGATGRQISLPIYRGIVENQTEQQGKCQEKYETLSNGDSYAS
ncbi:hypothetical protein [Aestuariivirga sp.]|uniref:hypothetical protein n=1 Tax=Aestuariivirga sp. TaxID=2650926 RepID=UPI003BA92A46